MNLAKFTSGQHDPNCTFCPVCNIEAASVMKMDCQEWHEWLKSPRVASLRVSKESEMTQHADPPPSLNEAIKKHRAASGSQLEQMFKKIRTKSHEGREKVLAILLGQDRPIKE